MDASRKRLTLLACILGSAVVTLDATVVTVGLPAIREELGGGLAGQQWTANAYLVTLASLLLVGGALSDAFGVRRDDPARRAGAAGRRGPGPAPARPAGRGPVHRRPDRAQLRAIQQPLSG